MLVTNGPGFLRAGRSGMIGLIPTGAVVAPWCEEGWNLPGLTTIGLGSGVVCESEVEVEVVPVDAVPVEVVPVEVVPVDVVPVDVVPVEVVVPPSAGGVLVVGVEGVLSCGQDS